MTLDDFWKILEALEPEEAEQQLTERLERLSAADVIQFETHFIHVFRRAYDWKLWGAAYLIDGGCSDDGFMDFRYGLISRGRDLFERSLADPDSLAEHLSDDDFIPNEGFGYVAAKVYETMTGDDMPHPDLPPIGEPQGETWDFDDPEQSSARLPKIWKRYGDS